MLLEMEEKQGVAPPALLRKPELDRHQRWLVEEFQKLSRDRFYADGGPLALSTGIIRTYYDAFGMHYFDFDNFHRWMTAIDDIWLAEVTAKSKREQAAQEAKAKASQGKGRRR